MADPLKSEKFPDTIEEYTNTTYSKNEVIAGGVDDVPVTEIATFMYGMCLVLDIEPKDHQNDAKQPNKLQNNELHVRIGLNTTRKITAYFVDHGQEICLIYAVPNCDIPQGIVVQGFYTKVKIKAKTALLEER